MINTIIIEDEFLVREGLKKMLKLIEPKINIINEFSHVTDAVNFLNNNIVDLVFLDIELEDGTGFDILEQVKETNFKIIFTTAYNEYAITAFKFSAIDYLMKPLDPSELTSAIDRAMFTIKIDKEYQELLSVLKNNIINEEKKIVLKTTENRYIIDIKNIIHLIADGAYTEFVTKDRHIIVSKNIKYYQNIIGNSFIRTHQSHLVNSKHIKSVLKNDKLIMSNDDLIPISTRKKSEILQVISKL